MGVVSRDKNTSAILFNAKSKLEECKGVFLFHTVNQQNKDGGGQSTLLSAHCFPLELLIIL